MKYFALDKSEEKLLKKFEAGDFISVKNAKKEISKYKQYAQSTLGKNSQNKR